MQKATFAAGCFWGVQKIIAKIPGVVDTQVGYTGGHTINPSYEQVCRGDTGHAESIEVSFDPSKISYNDLLEVFWEIHNPTTLNRQGPDIGTQYRSAIFYHDAEQRQQALASKTKWDASKAFNQPIMTEITAATEFYPAEEYHQHYSEKHGKDYC